MHSLTVLVVEDDEGSRLLQETLFTSQGCRVLSASNGREAWDLLQENEVGLIISDIMMPEMDGYALCRKCKSEGRFSNIPFVFYTATYTDPKDEQFALDLGASKFIEKPMEVDVFLKEVKKVLEEHRKHDLPVHSEPEKPQNELAREYSAVLGRKLDKKVREIDEIRRRADLSEERYRQLVELAPIGIMRSTARGLLVTVNAHLAEMLGYASANAMLGSVARLADDVYMDPAVRERQTERLQEKGMLRNERCQFKRGDGTPLWVAVSSRMISNIRGEVEGYEEFVSDISERKRAEDALRHSEERLDMAMQAVSDGLWDIDLNTRDAYFSPRYYQMLGYEPNEFPANDHSWRELVHPDDIEALSARLADQIAHAKPDCFEPPFSAEFRMRTKSGEWRWMMGRGQVVAFNEDGSAARVMGTNVDITERKRTEEFIVQSERMMTISGLTAGLAHEINNPLAAILGTMQNIQNRLLQDSPKNVQVAEEAGVSLDALRRYLQSRGIPGMLDSVVGASRRAADIVTNMLSFSRRSEVLHAPHNLPELMERTLDLAAADFSMKGTIDFRQIRITRDYDPNVPVVACAGNAIQQVFLNLLKNGAEAMADKEFPENESPCFAITMRCEGAEVVTEIEDNGPGMDADTLERLFEPFFTTKPEGRGTGLGLSVSHYIIVSHHQGSLRAESAPGQGTRFIIRLPLPPAEECG